MGKRGPKPIGSTRVNATVPDALSEALRAKAAARNEPLAAIVREALARGLDRDDDQEGSDEAA